MMATTRFADVPAAPGSYGEIFDLIRTGTAVSRSALARATGQAPSTVGTRVDVLQTLGLIDEDGVEQSRGGRRARGLALVPSAGYIVGIDFGFRYLKLAVADLSGTILETSTAAAILELGPAEAVEVMWERTVTLMQTIGQPVERLRGIAVGLPAPVDYRSGRVVMPTLMPAWHNANVIELFASYTTVPVLVENDANLLGIAEVPDPSAASSDYVLAVQLGTHIGSGMVVEGKLLRGFNGAAGEISHAAVAAEPMIPCVCGEAGCLASVTSGSALAARLSALGYDVEDATDVAELARAADPQVVHILREAGRRIGVVVASAVNFFNPNRVVLGGALSASPPLVSAIRAELFQRCLPIATQDLEVVASSEPQTAGLRGAVRLLLEEILAPARIEVIARGLAEDSRQPI